MSCPQQIAHISAHPAIYITRSVISNFKGSTRGCFTVRGFSLCVTYSIAFLWLEFLIKRIPRKQLAWVVVPLVTYPVLTGLCRNGIRRIDERLVVRLSKGNPRFIASSTITIPANDAMMLVSSWCFPLPPWVGAWGGGGYLIMLVACYDRSIPPHDLSKYLKSCQLLRDR